MFMNKLKRILILGLIAILCFSVIPTTVAYADSQPFSITGSDGNTYTPVKTDIAAEQEGEIHPTVYCLWVPEDVANLTIRAADTYTTIECSCGKGTLTSENGENVLSLPTSEHDSFCLQLWLSLGSYPGYEKYIDGSCENLIQVKVAAINGGVVTEINYILIQVGGTKLIEDSQPFTITGSDGNTYTPVKTDIAVQDGEIVPTVYCLWVPKDVANLTIRAADTYKEMVCECGQQGPVTNENGENIMSLPTSGHSEFCLKIWLGIGNYPGYEKYIDGNCEDLIQVKLIAKNDGVITEINYILIQVGGSVPTEDTTPPELSLIANGVQRTGETTATVKFTSSEAGTVYYSLVSADAVDTSTAGTAMVSGENTLNITGITADATTVYIKAKDGSGNVSESTLEAAVPAYETTYEIYLGLWSHAQYYDLGYRVASVTADGRPLSMSGISEVECSGVKAGQTVKVTLYIPETGKELASVSLITNDGNNTPINATIDGTENSFTFTMPAANVRTAIGESFTLKDSSIVRYSLKSGVSLLYSNVGDIESNRQGTVTFTDSNGVTLMQAQPGQQVTVTAQPVPYTAGDVFHRKFVCWKGIKGIEVSTEDQLNPSFTFTMPASDVYLFAEINNVGTEITWKTEPSDVTDIKLEDLGSNYSPFTFADGATLHAFPIVEEGWWYRYEFTGWTVERDGATLPDSEVSTSLVNSSRPKGSFGYATKVEFKASGEKMIVTANFRERAFASVTAVADATMGSATVAVGDSTPAETQSVVYEGQTVTLTATPGNRYTLTGWEVKDTNNTTVEYRVAEDVNVATFIMPATKENITAKAIFKVDPDKASPACDLSNVTLDIPGATSERNGTKYTIKVPADTDEAALAQAVLNLEISEYAAVKKTGEADNWPAAGKSCGMKLDTPVTFTVTAEDGKTTQDYTVTITKAKSSEKNITAAVLLDQTGDITPLAVGTVSEDKIIFTLPSNTDKAVLNSIGMKYLKLTYPETATAKMVNSDGQDAYGDTTGSSKWRNGDVMCNMSLNTPAKFIITAEDGSTKTYTVTIKYTAPNAPTLSNGSATRTSKTAATVKFTSSEAGSYFYQVVDHGAAAPTVDTSKNGTSAVKGENTITLSNLTGDARDIYIVVVGAAGGESTALKVEIPAYGSGSETPDTGKFTITINAPKGGTITTNRTKADKGDEIIVTVTPDSGYQMVADSLTYTLAVDGGETVKITNNRFTMPAGNVTITCKWETATTTVKGITSFSINGVAGAVNNSTNTITITMPRGTDVTKLTPTISTNGVKSLTPGSGETVNFTNSVTYTATMEDGSTKTYTVTVYVEKGTLADQFWDKLTDFVNQVPWWEYAEKQQSTSKYPKYW
jgi:hypothetical protein